MTAIHEVECDGCGSRHPLTYNGEHWLAPKGWVALYDDHLSEFTKQHLCDKCKPQPKKKNKGPRPT